MQKIAAVILTKNEEKIFKLLLKMHARALMK